MEKIQVVKDTLGHIKAIQPIWLIANKIDLLDKDSRQKVEALLREYDPVYVSAVSQEGIEELKARIYTHFV